MKKRISYLEFRQAMLVFKVFSIRDVIKLFPQLDTRRLFEWQKKGYLKKLINKWYIFLETQPDEMLLYRAANCINKPSYISLASALSYYNIIPEAVYSIQSVTTHKTQSYDTPVGHFDYQSIKPSLFFGYTILHIDGLPLLIAEIEKAILDYLYFNPGLRSEEDINAIRLNRTGLQSLDWKKFDNYAAIYNSKAMDARINLLKKSL